MLARFRISPIIEGKGEVLSIKKLLSRIRAEFLGDCVLEVTQPQRHPRGNIVRETDLKRYVRTAHIVLDKERGLPANPLVLILLDADMNDPEELCDRIRPGAEAVDSRIPVICAAAYPEYETWFVAAARSLVEQRFLRLKPGEDLPQDPEARKFKKGWIEERFVARNVASGVRATYSPTQDQPAMTQAMNLTQCRDNAPSFDRLCRDLMQLCGPRE